MKVKQERRESKREKRAKKTASPCERVMEIYLQEEDGLFIDIYVRIMCWIFK